MSDFKIRLKCTKIVFGWGSAPDSAGGAYDAPPDPLVGWEGIGARAPPFSCLWHSPRFCRPWRRLCLCLAYCVNCTKFGQLILRIIIKIDATRCQIFRLKCTKIVFGWGSSPSPRWRSFSAPPCPLAGLKGLGGEGIWEGRGRGGKGGGDRRGGRDGKGGHPPIFY